MITTFSADFALFVTKRSFIYRRAYLDVRFDSCKREKSHVRDRKFGTCIDNYHEVQVRDNLLSRRLTCSNSGDDKVLDWFTCSNSGDNKVLDWFCPYPEFLWHYERPIGASAQYDIFLGSQLLESCVNVQTPYWLLNPFDTSNQNDM